MAFVASFAAFLFEATLDITLLFSQITGAGVLAVALTAGAVAGVLALSAFFEGTSVGVAVDG